MAANFAARTKFLASILVLLSLFTGRSFSSSPCSTVFHAQSISPRRLRDFEFYLNRRPIQSAAECARVCEMEKWCRTAVYNHKFETCKLSKQDYMDCSTYHLSADGADPLSLLSCIEQSCHRKLSKSFFATFTTMEPQQQATTERLDGGPEPPLNLAMEPAVVPSQSLSRDQIPLNLDSKYDDKTRSDPTNKILDTSTKKAEEAKLSKVAASENSDNNGTTSDMAFKNIRQRLSEIQARLDQLKVKNQKAIVPPQQQKERGVVRPAEVQKQQGVNFRPQPLQLSKVIGGGSPSAEKAEEQKDDAGVAGRNNTAVNKVEERVTTEERIINVFKNSTEEQFHSAGFIRRLKPGERIKILSTNESKRNDGTELIQLVKYPRDSNSSTKELGDSTIEIPAQLVTLAPNLFVREGLEPRGEKKGKSVEITNKASSSLPESQGNRLASTSEAPTAKSEKTDAIFVEKLNKRIIEDGEEPVVVNGRLIKGGVKSLIVSTQSPVTKVREQMNTTEDKSDAQGFRNTFVMSGVSGLMKHRTESTAGENRDAKEAEIRSKPEIHVDAHNKSDAYSSKQHNQTSEPSTSIVCFRYIPQQSLYHAAYRTAEGVSLNECRCKCAESWRDGERGGSCKSIQYTPSKRECKLNSDDHNGKMDLIFDKDTDYHYVSCEVKYLMIAAKKMCKWDKAAGPSEVRNSLRPTKNEGVPGEIKEIEFKREKLSGEELSRETLPTSTPRETTIKGASAFGEKNGLKISENGERSATKNVKTVDMFEGCVERIDGYSMGNTAGALVRNTSAEECICHCISSSQRYKFHCTSATFYPEERECVLNLGNRNSTPEYFEARSRLMGAPLDAIYLGMKCSKDQSAKICEIVTPSSSVTNEKKVRVKDDLGDGESTMPGAFWPAINSDQCFLEMPNYVLEGIALAVEINVTVEQCKCFCLGFKNNECQSFQFYYDSKTCLLSRENRVTDPNRFTYDGYGSAKHSYFDHVRCQNDKIMMTRYMDGVCPNLKCLDSECSTIEDRRTTPTFRSSIDAKSKEAKSYMEENAVIKSISSDYDMAAYKNEQRSTVSKYHALSSMQTSLTTESQTSAETTTTITSTTPPVESLSTRAATILQTESSTTIPTAKSSKIPTATPMSEATTTKNTQILTTSEQSIKTTTIPERRIESKLPQEKFTKLTTQSQTTVTTTEDQGDDEDDEDDDEEDVTKSPDNKVKNGNLLQVVQDSGDDEKSIAELEEAEGDVKANVTVAAVARTKPTSAMSLDTSTVIPPSTGTTKSNQISTITTTTTNSTSQSSSETSPQATVTVTPTVTGMTPTQSETTVTPSSLFTTLKPTTPSPTTKLTITTTKPSTTTFDYPPIGKCRFSALYQTTFNGNRLLKRLLVASPIQCLQACHAEKCRSANLVQMEDKQKVCELFLDSIIEFRRNDVLSFDRASVHFDSIMCDSATTRST